MPKSGFAAGSDSQKRMCKAAACTVCLRFDADNVLESGLCENILQSRERCCFQSMNGTERFGVVQTFDNADPAKKAALERSRTVCI